MKPETVTIRIQADTTEFLEKIAEAQRVTEEFAAAYARIRLALGVPCPCCGRKPDDPSADVIERGTA